MTESPAEFSFVKMHGAGNDYVFVDTINQSFPLAAASKLSIRVSDRHKGIGGDGLILLARSEEADIRMLMWNADGSRGSMCGNGLRCLAKLAYDLGCVDRRQLKVETDSGIREVVLLPELGAEVSAARVDMSAVQVSAEAECVEIDKKTWQYHAGDAGNPHAVIFLDDDLTSFPIHSVGEAFQTLVRFPDGVNVEFVTVSGPNQLDQRTFERGSGETQACGSGATVAALAAMESGRLPGPAIMVRLLGGELLIERRGDTLAMEGPAEEVFRGRLRLEPQASETDR